jgi:molybdopterin synthase sulfur carrier subunit
MITIFIPTPLRRFAAEQSKVNVRATTVADAIKSLTSIHPSLSPYIYDEADLIRKHVRIYLGEEDIREKQGVATVLKEGDELSIIPAIAGGTI